MTIFIGLVTGRAFVTTAIRSVVMLFSSIRKRALYSYCSERWLSDIQAKELIVTYSPIDEPLACIPVPVPFARRLSGGMDAFHEKHVHGDLQRVNDRTRSESCPLHTSPWPTGLATQTRHSGSLSVHLYFGYPTAALSDMRRAMQSAHRRIRRPWQRASPMRAFIPPLRTQYVPLLRICAVVF